MRRQYRWLWILLIACAGWSLGLSVQPARSEGYRFAIGTEPSFSSGNYGTGSNIDITYVPLILEFYPSERLRLTGELPWVRQTSSEFTAVGGMGMFQHVQGGNFQTMNVESGPGDILFRGEYTLLPETADTPALIVAGDLKIPTADESKGLGTGKWDTGLAVELGKTIGESYVYGRIGYTFLGGRKGLGLDNPFHFEGGIGHNITSRLSLNAFLEGSTAIDNSFDAPLSTGINGDYQLRSDLSLTGYFQLGLSDGSPDYGLGIGFLQKF